MSWLGHIKCPAPHILRYSSTEGGTVPKVEVTAVSLDKGFIIIIFCSTQFKPIHCSYPSKHVLRLVKNTAVNQ